MLEPGDELDILVEGHRPRAVPGRFGQIDLVLTGKDEQWQPGEPHGFMTLDDMLSLRPTETSCSWRTLEERYAKFESLYMGSLVRSILAQGVLTPIEVDLDLKVVERGHHRLVAALWSHVVTVPYVIGRREERWCWVPATGLHEPYRYDLSAFDEEDDEA